MTFKILVPIGCRSDEGLSAPVIRRLKEQDWCKVDICQLTPQDFGTSYQHMKDTLYWKPADLVLITGDRVEMCAAAAAAFHAKVKIAHLYAGVVNDPITTFDDVDRHCITLWSDIQLCESMDAVMNVWALKDGAGLPFNDYCVGITHLDDMVIDESLVPIDYMPTPDGDQKVIEPYDLVLFNTEPLVENVSVDLLIGTTKTILIGSNPDGRTPLPVERFDEYYPNLPRAQFLGLLKNCRRFITNSSAAIYEAPYFLKPEQIIMVGLRNRNRTFPDCKPGGSDRIVEVLKEYAGSLHKEG